VGVRSQALTELQSRVPEAVLRGWREVDAQCREYSWYNVLGVFAAARAKQLGIRPREPRLVVCSCCSANSSSLTWRTASSSAWGLTASTSATSA
jgi:hypothetical protein